jgi:hypothetical protein
MQLKRLGFVMIGGVMASMLSACGGQQVAPSVVAMGSTPSMTKTMPEHTPGTCRGVRPYHFVTVSPCPIAPGLGQSEGVTVTISGRKIVSSSFDDTSEYCDDRGTMRKCVVGLQVAPTQWLVYYRNCNGRGHVKAGAFINGIDKHGEVVGGVTLDIRGLPHHACNGRR